MVMAAAKKEAKAARELISKDMALGDIITKYPKAAEVFMKYGLHCIGCHVSEYETVEQGAAMHGVSGAKFAKMMKELNEAAENKG